MKLIILLLVALGVLVAGAVAVYAWPRPQDPRDRPYRIEPVRFPGGPGVMLAGELTMPHGDGPFPAAVLITGSGPQDRDETVVGHRPFLVLSDHLTRAGYAVLRFDDRGVGESTGRFEAATMTDFAEDAAGAFRFLTEDKRIDATAIGFIGHSEGGYIAPVAAGHVPAAFLVLLAGPAKPLLPDVMVRQFADVNRAEGFAEKRIADGQQHYRDVTRILSSGEPLHEIRTAMDWYLASSGLSKRERAANLETWGTAWAVGYAGYDPLPALKGYPGPVLALFGGTDLQVSAEENAPVMRAALSNPKSSVEVFKGLNHLFQPSKTGKVSDYLWIDTTIHPDVLDRIAAWLGGLTGEE